VLQIGRPLLVLVFIFASFTQLVAGTNTTTTLASSLNPSTYGAAVTFTATVSPAAATGTVTFKKGTTTLGTGTLSGGKATYSTPTLAVGSNSITASYGGSSTYNSSTSSALTQTVNKASPTVTLTSSANPSTYGGSVTFTATLSISTATGTVTFKNGTTTLGTGTVSSGKATYATATLAPGSNSITASYGGDTDDNSATSSTLTQTVNKASPTVTLTSSANPSTYGNSVTFTAKLSITTATGTLTFKNGTATLGSGTVSSGKATYATSALAAGSNSITASYSGDTDNNSATSSALTQTVNKATPSVTLASSANPSIYGSSVTFTATLSISTASGTVTFKDGTTTLGTGMVSSGIATYATSTLAAGSNSITAAYGGDSNDNSSTSSKLTQTVDLASSVALASSANPSVYQTPVTFTATITPSAATGTITFYDGSTALGTGTIASGIATYTTSTLATGSSSITAVYGGSSTYAGNTSAVVTQSVFTVTAISVTPATATVPVAATQQFTATGTYSNGTQGNVTSAATWTSSATNVATISSAGIATGISEGSATIQATIGTVAGSATVTGAPSPFRFTGSLITGRDSFTATVLQSGKVLMVGGSVYGESLPIGTCELYDPVSGTFSETGSLIVPRIVHTATLLSNGTVLVVGGLASDGQGDLTETAVAELYNPSLGTFSQTGSLRYARALHTATLLGSGQVLIAGGEGVGSEPAQAELYSTITNSFSTSGSLNTPRDQHTATLLNDGTVLIAGGEAGIEGPDVAVAELYSSTAGTFATTGSMNAPGIGSPATLLNSGKVVIAGGGYGLTGSLARTETYDPVAKLFTLGPSLAAARQAFTATLLGNGEVLFAGGYGNNNALLATGELYNPSSGTISLAGNLNVARLGHVAAPLNNGMVLFAGGDGENSLILSSAETYQSTTDPPPLTLQITPAVVNMIVGGTQQFTAVDNNGFPRTDATWMVSNTSLATVTTNGNGTALVTALAAGQVTLTASAESVTAQEEVTILSGSSFPTGTTIWSAPPPAGYSVQQLAQAVPSASGPDLYSISQNANGTQSTIQALEADGEQLWQMQMAPIVGNSVPDGFGGLIVTTCASGSPMTVLDLDSTGQPLWQVTAEEADGLGYICYPPLIAVNAAGDAFIAEPTNAGLPSLTVATPTGGIESNQFLPSIVNSTDVPCCVGPPMVSVDGNTYVEYEVRYTTNNVITSDTLYLYGSTIGEYTVLSSTTQNEALLPGPIIPDGNGGILATWTVSPSVPPVLQFPYQIVDVTAGVVGTPYSLPFSPTTVTFGQSPTLALGENGVAFATDTTDSVNGPVVASFNVASGTVNWSYQAAPQYALSIIEATSGNGLVAKTTDQSGRDTAIIFNSSGTQTPSGLSGMSSLDYYSDGWWLSLTGGSPSVVFGEMVQPAMSSYFQTKGRNTKQSSAAPIIANFETVDPTTQGSATGFQGRYTATNNANSVSISQLTTATFAIYGGSTGANEGNFIGQVFKPIDAVSFIGHSLTTQSGPPAIGICFGQDGTEVYFDTFLNENLTLPLYPCISPLAGGYGFPIPAPTSTVIPTEYFDVSQVAPSTVSQAKIIFFAACDLDTIMQTFFGITNSTAGRALLFPSIATDIDLDMGEYEWEQIVAGLASGQNLQQAVANANAAVVRKAPWYNNLGQVVPPQSWQVIGDSGNGGTGIHF
jgi:hypothetical protein